MVAAATVTEHSIPLWVEERVETAIVVVVVVVVVAAAAAAAVAVAVDVAAGVL